MLKQTQILNNLQVEQILTRMAYEVYERNFNSKHLIIAAINGRGEFIADMLLLKLSQISKIKTTKVTVKINKDHPSDVIKLSDEKLKLNGATVVLVDDVLNTGRTLIYGMLPFLYNKIKTLQTFVLVNRNHNNFPVKADYIGLNLSTTLQEHIAVLVERKKVSVFIA